MVLHDIQLIEVPMFLADDGLLGNGNQNAISDFSLSFSMSPFPTYMYISLVYKGYFKDEDTLQEPKRVKRMSPGSRGGGGREAWVSLAVQFLLCHWGSKGRDSLQVSRKLKDFDSQV